MPKHDPTDPAPSGRFRRRGRRKGVGEDINDQFWDRPRETRRQDRRARNDRQDAADARPIEAGEQQHLPRIPPDGPHGGRIPPQPPPPSPPARPPIPPARGGPQRSLSPRADDSDAARLESGEMAAARRLARLTPWSTPAVGSASSTVLKSPAAGTPPVGPRRHATAGDPHGGVPEPYSGAGSGHRFGDAPGGPPEQAHDQTVDHVYQDVRRDIHGDVYDDAGDAGDVDDDELSRRRGCTRLAIGMGVVAAVLCAVLVVAGLWVGRKINPGGPPGEPVTIELVSGQSTPEIAQALDDHGVITDARIFTVYAWVRGSGDIQAGTYELRTNMAMDDVLTVLAGGPQPEPAPEGRSVTIPEGLTVDQTIARLVDPDDGVPGFDVDTLQNLIDNGSVRSRYLPEDQHNIEGILFPETYNVQEGVTELEFLERMVSEFEATFSDLDVETRAAPVGLSPYEVLIVASLIERETRIDDERPMVARVIYNRLDDGMALQIDATSCYEIVEDPCRLTTADLESDSPYNTRNRTGLPPTPIASPGRASLGAALAPADGDWFYYVRNDGEGGHLFTADADEFVRARQVCIDEGWGCG